MRFVGVFEVALIFFKRVECYYCYNGVLFLANKRS